MRYVKTELSYDAHFFHIARLQQKQQIDTVISSGLLTAWFLTHSFPLESGQSIIREGDILPNCMGNFQNFSERGTKSFVAAADFMVMDFKFL